MAKVKIVSNPYKKNIDYYWWSENHNEWVEINVENNPNSNLLCQRLKNGFFPFIVKDVVDVIIRDYYDGKGPIELIFEGTDDEYRDLELICSSPEYEATVTIQHSERILENARDILPDIIDVFKSLNPLISQSVRDKEKISSELTKFTDASNDIIPICVWGNYSSGKSTFINALIGREILPSGDEPITAKIYKIENSNQPDRAYIEFDFDLESVKIRFEETGFKIVTGDSSKGLLSELKEALSLVAHESITIRINKALEIINGFESTSENQISDLIKITVPFSSDIVSHNYGNIVIFDTPGSNSASNDKHFKVLKSAMDGFSNGLPIYVSEYDSLDSTDNEKLYSIIKEMEELDSRFTMIVVNKADAASLPKNGFSADDEKRLLNEATPKNLYSEGIYFISSVLGLGSKNKGDFIDDHYAEIFEDQSNKYMNPSSRFYKKLYIYNIMSEQRKKNSIQLSEDVSDNQLLYVNSGLCAIEQEISTFAGKYSSYNKCQQSQLFLGKLINITSEEIEAAKAAREESRRHRSETLEKDKAELIEQLENECSTVENKCIEDYHPNMNDTINSIKEKFIVRSYQYQESIINEEQESSHDYQSKAAAVQLAKDTRDENLKKNVETVMSSGSFKAGINALKNIGVEFISDSREVSDKESERKKEKRAINKDVSDQLLRCIKEDYSLRGTEAQKQIQSESSKYWELHAEMIKAALSKVVSGSSVLSSEKKDEISGIILQYEEAEFFDEADDIFIKKDFEAWNERLNITKLSHRFNEELTTMVDRLYESIRESHERSIIEWTRKLLDSIIENIVEYSPVLHTQSELIKEETQTINDLEQKQKRLVQYTREIEKMMDWAN